MSPREPSIARPRARRGRARRAALAGLALDLLGSLVAGCATRPISGLAIPTSVPGGSTEQIPAMLTRPEGPGPFAAVVIMHDCSGLGTQSSGAPGRWAAELGRRGYVILVPDSFTTRGHPDGVCVQSATGFALGPAPSRNDVSPGRRAHDAYAALAYLQTLPYVDGRRVGLMGGSHGGSTTLATMATRAERGFAAAVALYPSCAPGRRGWQADLSGVYRTGAPVLILIGERDDWTPAAPCVKLAEDARQAGQPVAITVYPGAHHSFDSDRPVRFRADRVNANAPGGRGATTGGDPQAWEDSIREVAAFFARHL
jgi:dienelactone hydrolase